MIAGASSAWADTAPAANYAGLAQGSQLTGDWWGLRSGLLQSGVDVEADLAVVGTMLSQPGDDSQRRYIQSCFNGNVRVDLGVLLGLPGGTLFADFESISGGNGSAEERILQNYSTIDAPHRDQINELWYQQTLWANTLAIKLGKIDVREDFDYEPVSAPFLNRGVSFSPTIVDMPTYPDPSTGISGTLDYLFLYAKAGVYDGSTATGVSTGDRYLGNLSGARFEIAEAGVRWGATPTTHLAEVAVGGWRQTATFMRFDGSFVNDIEGAYALADLQILGTPGAGGVAMFANGGFADPHVTVYARHLCVGITSTEPGGPHANAIGLAGTWVGTSRVAGSPCDTDETACELFVRYQAAGWLTLTPDVQWIRRPGGISDAHDLYLGQIRADIAF
jgi:porin